MIMIISKRGILLPKEQEQIKMCWLCEATLKGLLNCPDGLGMFFCAVDYYLLKK